jgi:LuxR family maltose regulon positive regulatory protein
MMWRHDRSCGDGLDVRGHLVAGFLALDRLDDAAVRVELDQLGDGCTPSDLWPSIALLGAQYALHAGGAADALDQLDRVEAAHGGGPCTAASTALMMRARADLLLACGCGGQAARVIRAEGGRLARVPVARLRALSGGDAVGADDGVWADDDDTGVQWPSIRDDLELLLLHAVAASRGGDARAARRLAIRAVGLHRRTGILRPFATVATADRVRLLTLAGGVLDPHDTARLAERAPVYPVRLIVVRLSRCEQNILEALAGTSSRQAIADSQFVSVNTVKTQLRSIYRKVGGTTREAILHHAREEGLLPIGGGR